MNRNRLEKQIIVGPCALESREHAQETIRNAQALGIQTIRMNLWKPRTRPGFEGVGKHGLPWVKEAAEQGMTPAMEVITAEHAELVMNAVLRHPHTTLLLWIGSRNQNHLVQQQIGQAVAGEPRVNLMLKNQPWKDETHWKGIVEHVIHGGADPSQLLLCHRGFAPQSETSLRNAPDLAMAERMRNELNLPMILDPSHIGGKKDLVIKLAQEFAHLPWVDGQIIEVHPNPNEAKTDAKQQLSWEDLAALLPIMDQEPEYA